MESLPFAELGIVGVSIGVIFGVLKVSIAALDKKDEAFLEAMNEGRKSAERVSERQIEVIDKLSTRLSDNTVELRGLSGKIDSLKK